MACFWLVTGLNFLLKETQVGADSLCLPLAVAGFMVLFTMRNEFSRRLLNQTEWQLNAFENSGEPLDAVYWPGLVRAWLRDARESLTRYPDPEAFRALCRLESRAAELPAIIERNNKALEENFWGNPLKE